jgi:hypothetical protein
MFHVTRASNISSILDHGIVPRIGDRALAFGETMPAVYAFPTVQDCHTALSQWLGDWFNDQEDQEQQEGQAITLVVVEFNAAGLAQLPREAAFEARFACTIPPSAFRALHSEEALGRIAQIAFYQDASLAA